MSYSTHGRVASHMRQMTDAPGLSIARLMDTQRVSDALDRCGVVFRDRVFNPVVTLWAFCWQVMILVKQQSITQNTSEILQIPESCFSRKYR